MASSRSRRTASSRSRWPCPAILTSSCRSHLTLPHEGGVLVDHHPGQHRVRHGGIRWAIFASRSCAAEEPLITRLGAVLIPKGSEYRDQDGLEGHGACCRSGRGACAVPVGHAQHQRVHIRRSSEAFLTRGFLTKLPVDDRPAPVSADPCAVSRRETPSHLLA